MSLRDQSDYYLALGRERVEGLGARLSPRGGWSVFGLLDIPEKIVRFFLFGLVTVVVLWVVWLWGYDKVRDHFTAEFLTEAQQKKDRAFAAQRKKIEAQRKQIESERAKRKAAEAREKEADQRADSAMKKLASSGSSCDQIDRLTINKIIREANAQ